MNKILPILTYGGYILIAIGVLIPLITGPQDINFKIVFSAGAALMLVGRLLTPNTETVMRAKRLVRLEIWSAIFFCAAAAFMWYTPSPRDWLSFTLAGALLQCYVSLMLPRARREGKTGRK